MILDWRWIVAKRIVNRKWENGFCVTFDTIFDHSEDFAKSTILSKGDVFIDAGAHCGLWSLQASKYYNRVIAFEPTRKSFKSLRTNLRMNRCNNVQAVEAAVSDKPGFARFYEWPDGPMGNSLYRDPVEYTDDYGVAGESYRIIKTVSIDSLVNVKPTVIKLDVEGAEYDAIKGATRTIRDCHPTFFIEIHKPQNERKIVDALPGYRWTKQLRLMQPKGKTEFYQTQMIGRYAVKPLIDTGKEPLPHAVQV